MAYEVLVHRKARDYYKRRQVSVQERLKKALGELASDPHTPRPKADIKRLSGTKGRQDAYRLRIGDYRIVYHIEDDKVYVTLIFHREKDYREL